MKGKEKTVNVWCFIFGAVELFSQVGFHKFSNVVTELPPKGPKIRFALSRGFAVSG